MTEWTTEGKGYLDEWSWPLPAERDLLALNVRPQGLNKGFAPLLRAMHAQEKRSVRVNETMPFDEVEAVAVFRKAISGAWREGKRIVFGTEEMDRIVSRASWSDHVMDGILNVLPRKDDAKRPLNVQDDVEVVINHRTPRVDHLKSVWHQVESNQIDGHGMSFQQFLSQRARDFHVTNSLELALNFLRRGLKTTIIHLMGMAEENREICHVMACDVMKANCTRSGYLSKIAHGIDGSKKRQNVRPNPASGLGLTEHQMNSINKVMVAYDCGLHKALLEFESTSQLQILFRHDFFKHCSSDAPTRPFQWMIDQIYKIATDVS